MEVDVEIQHIEVGIYPERCGACIYQIGPHQTYYAVQIRLGETKIVVSFHPNCLPKELREMKKGGNEGF